MSKSYQNEINTKNMHVIKQYSKLSERLNILFPRRFRRGILNGLGSIIKQITGNLDNNDKEKYDQLLEEIQQNIQITNNNNKLIAHQLNNATLTYDNQFKIIRDNQINIQSQLRHVQTVLRETISWENVFIISNTLDLINNNIIELNDIINNIEITLAFCSTNTFHISLLENENIKELMTIIKSNTDIQENEYLNYLNLIHSYCRIKNNKLQYLIIIPKFSKTKYVTRQITPIPFLQQNQLLELNFIKQLLIKINNVNYICENLITVNYENFCKTKFETTDLCSETLMEKHNSKNCNIREISKENNIIEIENSNIIYIIQIDTPQELKCSSQNTILKDKGIYKITEPNCQINGRKFNNKLISKPIILEIEKSDIIKNKIDSLKTIDIKDVKLKDLSLFELQELNKHHETPHYHYQYVLLTIIIIIICLYLIVKNRVLLRNKLFKQKKENVPIEKDEIPLKQYTL